MGLVQELLRERRPFPTHPPGAPRSARLGLWRDVHGDGRQVGSPSAASIFDHFYGLGGLGPRVLGVVGGAERLLLLAFLIVFAPRINPNISIAGRSSKKARAFR